MDDVHDSEQPPVYHADIADWVIDLAGGAPPRLFALVREKYSADDVVEEEVLAYGIELPDGSAATVPVSGRSFGRWLTPQSASRRMFSELVWLSPAP